MRYFDKIGYCITEEDPPESGVFREYIVEKPLYGDVIKQSSRYQSDSKSLNDNITVNVQLSVVADAFAYQNFSHIRYAYYMGVRWKVTNVDVQHPRLTLTLGGEYNGEQA